MSIHVFPFDAARYADTGELFPEHIGDDSWVVYHGTSAQFSDDIEREGLQWKPTVSGEEVRRLVGVFEGIDWFGTGRGGMDVLCSYTKADFKGTDGKPLSVAETIDRCVWYAERDMAGGETARACRIAFEDLERWLSEPEKRSEFRRGMGLSSFTTLSPPDVPQPDAWVRERVAELVDLRARCSGLVERHQAGVVYAIRLSPDFVQHLGSESGGGYSIHAPIPCSMLVGKVVLPADIRCRRMAQGDSDLTWKRWTAWEQDPNSLQSAYLAARKR